MKRLLLVGGGHAHLHILASLARYPLPSIHVTLVSPFPAHHYSGMVPGYLQGIYSEADIAFDLARLCERAGVQFTVGYAREVDTVRQVVPVGAAELPFDYLSLDVGSEPLGLDTPGVREHAYTVRPMSRAVALRHRLETLGRQASGSAVAVTVVGAGAGGVEVALASVRELMQTGAQPAITLVEADDEILPDHPERARQLARRILARQGVRLLTGTRALRLTTDAVELSSGVTLPTNLVIWLTGAAPPALLSESALPKDGRGFLLVDQTLRAVNGVPVWGAGDCVTLQAHPNIAKAGVYAVREAPILDHNLRAAITVSRTDSHPRPYVPQPSFLALLNTADGKALLRWRGVVSHSRAAWWLKDHIDRTFVRRYRQSS